MVKDLIIFDIHRRMTVDRGPDLHEKNVPYLRGAIKYRTEPVVGVHTVEIKIGVLPKPSGTGQVGEFDLPEVSEVISADRVTICLPLNVLFAEIFTED